MDTKCNTKSFWKAGNQTAELCFQITFGRGIDREIYRNLDIINDVIISAIDNDEQVDVVFTDFAKSFDKVPHNVLIEKLRLLGVRDPLLLWIFDYMKDKVQVVCIKGFKSKYLYAISGVPQRSHLDPLLFTIFINDMRSVLKYSRISLYADDAKSFRKIN